MTRFVFQGSGHTTGGGGALALLAVGAGAALAYEALRPAAQVLGDLLVIVPVTLGGVALGVIATVLAVRARGRRAAPPAPVQLWHANPQAIPPQPRREIAAPVVNVNIDAGLLAGLMEAARRQPAPVIVQAETEELPR